MTKKPQTYPLRYVEDFFGVSNEVAVKLSKCGTGNHFSSPCYHPVRAELNRCDEHDIRERFF